MFNKRITDAIENSQDFSSMIMHGYTYSGHPTACAAALEVLNIVEEENLPENAKQVGSKLLSDLHPLVERHAAIGEVRGKGLMIALDLVQNKATREPVNPQEGYADRIAEAARQQGVLVRPVGTKIILSPPLTLTCAEAEKIVQALENAFSSVK